MVKMREMIRLASICGGTSAYWGILWWDGTSLAGVSFEDATI